MAKLVVYHLLVVVTVAMTFILVESANTNHVYSPCSDATVQLADGFTFGIAFASRQSFFYNSNQQLSPWDRRLSLSSSNSQISVFRPKVDEMSLLTINTSSFSPVLQFKKGRLKNLYWKRDGYAKCAGNSGFPCLNNQDCAIKTSNCKNHNGNIDCSLGIQLAFSGTDKHLSVMNSWYELENLRQYSLYGLYSNLKNSLTGEYSKIF